MNTNENSGLINETRALQRQQEIIADIGFNLGNWWRSQTIVKCNAITDRTDGSRGLMQLVIEWAKEFDAYWEALPEEEKEDYIEKIDDFTDKKIDEEFGK